MSSRCWLDGLDNLGSWDRNGNQENRVIQASVWHWQINSGFAISPVLRWRLWQQRIQQETQAATQARSNPSSCLWGNPQEQVLHSANTDFHPWVMSAPFSHPLLKPLPNSSLGENHIPHPELHLCPAGGRGACPYLPLLLGGSQLEGRVCMPGSRGVTDNDRKIVKVLICFLLYFPVFTILSSLEWKNEKPIVTVPTNQFGHIPHSICNVSSVLAGGWTSRQSTAGRTYLNWGVFFREQMPNLLQHFR